MFESRGAPVVVSRGAPFRTSHRGAGLLLAPYAGVNSLVLEGLRVSHSLTDLAGLTVSAEDLLAVVMETTAEPICVVDPDGCIRFANPAGRRRGLR